MKLLSIFSLFFLTSLHGQVQLIKHENSDSNTTLLIIAGIHGNEPGGYFAASILATNYAIVSNNVWIVPNLNQASILRNRRGIHGDMNRKFSVIKKNDKDMKIIKEIKNIILAPQVSLVLNLHDGHGFYRKKYQGSIFNPTAWGQTCVIDQCNLKEEQEFGNLTNIASTVKNNVNTKLLEKHHSFNVKNTKTKYEDEAMQLSLTYFAVTNNKPAFAVETSKNLKTLSQKVFYQLLAIEEFMKIMHITYKRNFTMNEKSITKIIKNYGKLNINNTINLNLGNIKKHLRFIPIKYSNNVFHFSHPLGAYRKVKDNYQVYIGNKKITTLRSDYFKIKPDCIKSFDAIVDGKLISIKKTSSFDVKADFKILKTQGIRVNVIGFHSKKSKDESNILIKAKDLNKVYSVDKKHKIYRVEFYEKDRFCSMSMVNFK